MHWRSGWTSALLQLQRLGIPILSDLGSSSWPNWRESFKQLFVILFFSLMPLWLPHDANPSSDAIFGKDRFSIHTAPASRSHSIISSTNMYVCDGIVRPNATAVLRLMVICNRLG